MANELKVINEQIVFGKEFRMYGDIDNPPFLAKDVVNWIEHSNTSVMLSKVDNEEKQLIEVSTLNNAYSRENDKNLVSNKWFLSEDGLYEVLMQSRKPIAIAKQFKKKVKEILKDIRRDGGYIVTTEEDDERK